MKLGHIVKYHIVFFKFDNGPYRTMLSVVMALCPLSNLNIFDQNFMKLGHTVKYYDVFFKFDNGLYRTMLSRVMSLCL